VNPPPPTPRPSGHARRATALELLCALSYELLDAHHDTIALAADLPDDRWRAHLDYLRALQRRGRELLAQAWSAEAPR
jgi:hypothetical protein